MARIVKAPDERRSELIATAQRLFYEKGYERTSISDIVKAVGVAQGTFYYYFGSKTAVLEALVDDVVVKTQGILHEIVADENLDAISKWQQAQQATTSWKIERKTEMLELRRLLMSEENVRLVHKLQVEVSKMTANELAKIVAQGVEEGVFTTQFVAESAKIIVAIMSTFGNTMNELIFNPDKYDNRAAIAVRQGEAVQTAVESVLGAPPGSLQIFDPEIVKAWFTE